MRRLMACFLLSGLVGAALCGCGAVRIAGFFNTGAAESVAGFVSGVQITNIPGPGSTTVVTIVTFQQTLGFITQNFCGDFGTQFPKNSFAQVSFNPGQPCASIVAIIIT